MNQFIPFLKSSEIFFQFTQTQLELVANLCQEKTYRSDEIIFEENSNSKELYIIEFGEVEILINQEINGVDGKKEKKCLAKLSRGQSFGEIALVDEGLRTATAQVREKETRLLVIQRDNLLMLCETYPQLGFRLMHNLAADLAMKVRTADLNSRENEIY